MLDPQGAFDLRTFPRDEKERLFLNMRASRVVHARAAQIGTKYRIRPVKSH